LTEAAGVDDFEVGARQLARYEVIVVPASRSLAAITSRAVVGQIMP